ncbi:MAG: DUF1178 family protein [Rhodobacteraceae bacterium]|nr:DUF1178 family protein [Paracoccaceae bacterium]
MIRYSLKCEHDHSFESWFQSAEAFDTLLKTGMVVCPECQSTAVTKTLMAPQVQAARKKADAPTGPLSAPPEDPRAAAIEEIRAHVEANSDYVGMKFADEARAMHDGDVPNRAIYGEAKPEEAKKLLEDGVPVAPLPFVPRNKTN